MQSKHLTFNNTMFGTMLSIYYINILIDTKVDLTYLG